MMSCVIPNSAAPAGGRPLTAARRGVTAQEEKKSPTRTTARNPNARSFTVIISAFAKGKDIKRLQGKNRAELLGI
jgi:cell division septation protein DedD